MYSYDLFGKSSKRIERRLIYFYSAHFSGYEEYNVPYLDLLKEKYSFLMSSVKKDSFQSSWHLCILKQDYLEQYVIFMATPI